MNNNLEVIVKNVNGELTVSSRVIAEQLGKRHDHVIRDLNKILENPNVGSLIIPSFYKVEEQKRQYKEYLLTKDGFILYMFNIQGHNDFKMAYINRFNEMEKELKNQFQVPTSFKEALKLALEQQEKIETLELDNKVKNQQIAELQPKASYYDRILQSKSTVTITQIAKDYGMSGRKLNKTLNDFKVQYKQGAMWLLYQHIADKGYTHSNTLEVKGKDGITKVVMNTKWTQKGRLFLYDLLKSKGILPLIEQN